MSNSSTESTRKRMTANSPSGTRWMSDVLPQIPLFCLLLPTLLLGCIIGALATTHELTDASLIYQRSGPYLIGLTLTLVSIGAIIAIGAKTSERHLRTALIVTLVATCVMRIGYASLTVEMWRGDFLSMWNAAVSMAEHGLPKLPTIYHWRALPLLTPLVYLFGPHPVIVPIFNIVLLGTIQLIGSASLMFFGKRRAALVFALIFAAVPETYHATITTSHDIWGLFFFSLLVLCFAFLVRQPASIDATPWRYRATRILVLAAFGISVALLNLQRQIGPVVILALSVYAVAAGIGWLANRRSASDAAAYRRTTKIVIALLVSAICGMAIWSAGIGALDMARSPDEKAWRDSRLIAGNGPSIGTGYFSWVNKFENTYLKALPSEPKAWKDFSQSLVLSDLANQPMARLHNHLFRLYRQFNLGSNYRFYLMHMHSSDPARYWTQRIWNAGFSTLFCIAVGLALLLSMARARQPALLSFQLYLLGALLLMINAFGESQPRYIFPIWFVGAQLLAISACALPRRNAVFSCRQAGANLTAAAGCLLVSGGLGWVVLNGVFQPAHGRIIDGWSFSTGGARDNIRQTAMLEKLQSGSGRGLRAGTTHNEHLALLGNLGTHAIVLGFPAALRAGESVSATSPEICGSSSQARDLAFFLAADEAPDDMKTTRLEIDFGTTRIFELDLPTDAALRHHVVPNAIPPGACGTIRASLEAIMSTPSKRAQRLTRIELQFIRLVEPDAASVGHD